MMSKTFIKKVADFYTVIEIPEVINKEFKDTLFKKYTLCIFTTENNIPFSIGANKEKSYKRWFINPHEFIIINNDESISTFKIINKKELETFYKEYMIYK